MFGTSRNNHSVIIRRPFPSSQTEVPSPPQPRHLPLCFLPLRRLRPGRLVSVSVESYNAGPLVSGFFQNGRSRKRRTGGCSRSACGCSVQIH